VAPPSVTLSTAHAGLAAPVTRLEPPVSALAVALIFCDDPIAPSAPSATLWPISTAIVARPSPASFIFRRTSIVTPPCSFGVRSCGAAALHQPLESCRYRQGADKGGACDAGGRRYGRRDPVNIGVFRRSVVYRLSFGRRDDTNSALRKYSQRYRPGELAVLGATQKRL